MRTSVSKTEFDPRALFRGHLAMDGVGQCIGQAKLRRHVYVEGLEPRKSRRRFRAGIRVTCGGRRDQRPGCLLATPVPQEMRVHSTGSPVAAVTDMGTPNSGRSYEGRDHGTAPGNCSSLNSLATPDVSRRHTSARMASPRRTWNRSRNPSGSHLRLTSCKHTAAISPFQRGEYWLSSPRSFLKYGVTLLIGP